MAASITVSALLVTVIQTPNVNPRCARMKTISILLACVSLAVLVVVPAQVAVEITASRSLTIQPGGSRSGENASKYFNVEGKDNKQYASFGVLIFEIPKEVQDKMVKSVTLTLVQSIPRFAKDGAMRFYLAPDLSDAENLKFDTSALDGLGNRIMAFHAMGSGNFKKVETGTTESFSLTVNDAVHERIAKGGKLYLVVVPADATVAATYFGANESAKNNSPRLTLDLP
jgi:hypothetical protein